MSTMSVSSDFAQSIATPLAKRAVNPLIVSDIDGKQLSFLFQHLVGFEGKPTAYGLMKKQDNCHVCADRFAQLYAVSDLDGSIWSEWLTNIYRTIESTYYYEHASLFSAQAVCTSPITKLILLKDPTVMNHCEEVGGFHHMVRRVNQSNITTCDDSVRISLIEKSISQYVISGLFEQFVFRLILHSKDSLDLVQTNLNEHSYNHKYIPVISWCKAILDDLESRLKKWDQFTLKEKIGFAIHHIIRAGLTKDSIEPTGIVATLFKIANSYLILLLEDAKAKDAKAKDAKAKDAQTLVHNQYMSKVVCQMLNVKWYSYVNPEQIAYGIKQLGDFTNSILDETQAKELIPEMVFHSRTLTTGTGPDSTSFTARSKKLSLDTKIKNIKTFGDFIKLTRKYPELTVEISASLDVSIAYVASTTLGKDIVSHRHLWNYWNLDTSIQKHGLYTSCWTAVSHTIPMYEYILGYKNVIFVCPKFKTQEGIRNCCLPAVLTPQYKHVYGPAFSALNQITQIASPSGQLMAGFGVSVHNNTNKFSYPVELRVNGIRITLRTL